MALGISLFLIGVGAAVAVPMHAVTGATSTLMIGLLMIAVGVLGLVAERLLLAPRRAGAPGPDASTLDAVRGSYK